MSRTAPAFITLCLVVAGGEAGAEDAARLAGETKAAADRAVAYIRSISTEGGYLWRYSADLKERAGETAATPTQIWVQPPGTPSVGEALLRAYEATQDPAYLDAALAAADALATGQLESGGWDYRIDFDPEQAKRSYRRTDAGKIAEKDAAKRRNVSTYDDDTSQSAVRFLMAVADAAPEDDGRTKRVKGARDYALAKMLEAQYPNGAWPQRYDGKPKSEKDYPVLKASMPEDWPREWAKEDYSRHYTLNDHTMRDCVRTMLDAYRRYGDERYLAAAKRGGDFFILAQLPGPQPAWAQQYNARMEPAWARAFEPPAVTAGETAGVIRILTDLYVETGDEKYLAPIPAAIEWLKRSPIGKDRWARYYELGTNRPIYGDRDGKIHYTLAELSDERRTGYGWEAGFGIHSAVRVYEDVVRDGRDAALRRRTPKPPSEKTRAERIRAMGTRVRSVIAGLDEQGRWLTERAVEKGGTKTQVIETAVFIENLDVLSDYLKLARSD